MTNTAFTIDFQPIGKRITTGGEMSLLSLAQDAGISLSAVCGGTGVCGACKVICMAGSLSEVQAEERDAFSESELAQGWRLACMAYPRGDIKIEVPPESMTTTQRLQIEGALRETQLSPSVQVEKFNLVAPGLSDLRADWERFTSALQLDPHQYQTVDLPVLEQFSTRMREQGWLGAVVFNQDQQVVGFLREDQVPYGVAVDIGTTKMAAFLVDLATGKSVAKLAAMNPQIRYGEDVVSRIAYANQGPTQRQTLQACLVAGINELVENMCASVGCEYEQIADIVVVGNTAIHHLFAGLPVNQLGEAPYVAAVRQALRFPAREVGLLSAPGASVYMPPNIAGYVGADHVAMLLASGLNSHRKVDTRGQGAALALDIGTNTEISLSKGGRLVSCSCASGPAFEGAHIHAGMRAAPGAIERARFYDGDWHLATIEDQPPVGLCGSGILDVVAELLESGQIDGTGRFTSRAARRVPYGKGDAILLVPGTKSGTGKDILVTRSDIREIQLAKAAIRAGVDALLRATSTAPGEIDCFVVAGAFGTYLHLDSAIRIGMFPVLPYDRYHQVGNAAGAGAQEMLISMGSRLEAEAILGEMDYIELTTDPGFFESYVNAMGFDPVGKEL
jgi:uncharacterized 2Fe-2S/4Fe-4S cluster protein (DUF4445 family)